MRRKARHIRNDWFDRCALAASRYWPDGRLWFICPICLHGFSPRLKTTDWITFEDAPPRSLGGTRVALACKQYNHSAGAAIDHHGRKLEDIIDFHLGTMKRPIKGRYTIAGVDVSGEILSTGSGVHVTGVPQANNPEDTVSITEALDDMTDRGTWDGSQIHLTFPSFRWREALVTWLRAAYIASFAAFGYRYVLRSSLNIVRDQITQPGEDIIRFFSMTTVEADPSERRILLVTKPEWFKCVGVQVGRHFVSLPPIDDEPDFYLRLAAHIRQGKEVGTMSGKLVPWPTQPEMLLDRPVDAYPRAIPLLPFPPST